MAVWNSKSKCHSFAKLGMLDCTHGNPSFCHKKIAIYDGESTTCGNSEVIRAFHHINYLTILGALGIQWDSCGIAILKW